jgi:hypothetical protein
MYGNNLMKAREIHVLGDEVDKVNNINENQMIGEITALLPTPLGETS